jgi:flagellar motor switch protein FliM
LLGGKGDPLDKKREFSEIEVLLIEKILVICLQNITEPWKNVIELSPRLEKIETNSQFAQVISPTDVVALITLNMKLGPVEGLMNFCIPYLCLEPIMDKLNTKYWFSSIQNTNEELYKEIIGHQIDHAHVPLKAILGRTNITVSDFVNLQKGDIIKLSNEVDSELDVYVGNIKKFNGKPGIFNNKNAIKVTSIIREEE